MNEAERDLMVEGAPVGPAWRIQLGGGPVVAVSLHDGHALRPEVERLVALSPEERTREEDAWVSGWTSIAPTRVTVLRSRFELDLNRPREDAIYLQLAQSWGLRVWQRPPPPEVLARTLELHEAFYRTMLALLSDVERRHGRFVVLDLHSYNHRRGGPFAPADDPGACPEINVGTGSMNRARWAPVIERFMEDLRAQRPLGHSLDVRENIRFRGGWFPRWVHESFPLTGCALAIEVKKNYVDEWSGRLDPARYTALGVALAATIPGLSEALERVR